jgi:hypothetical protein
MSILKVLRERTELLNVAELAKLLRPFLHPRAPGNPDDYKISWTDLAELNPRRNIKPEEEPQNTKDE